MSSHKNQATTTFNLPLYAGIAAYVLFFRPQILKWGTELGESQRRLPGDELIPQPNFKVTHAINIDAPPEAVWPWLAQMGRERTGYYGLDLVTNNGIPSVTFIRKDIAEPETGMAMDGGYHIMQLEPQRQLLFGGFSLKRQFATTLDVTSLYLLERRRDGSTRLLTRQRAFSYGLPGAIYVRAYEPIYFLYSSQQLKNLKHHAESMAHLKL